VLLRLVESVIEIQLVSKQLTLAF